MSVSVLSAYQRLQAAEVDYLVKSEWERVGATQWARRGRAQVSQEDAVRLQKQHDATHLAAEVDRYKSKLLAQLEESEKNEAALRDQLKEQLKIVAELRAQLIERATPEFMLHHMTLTRQVANLQSECQDLRQRNMTLAGDMSVVRNSLDQANSERREAQESLRRMEEDKSRTVSLLKQSLERMQEKRDGG